MQTTLHIGGDRALPRGFGGGVPHPMNGLKYQNDFCKVLLGTLVGGV
jgi:hypothetical protein